MNLLKSSEIILGLLLTTMLISTACSKSDETKGASGAAQCANALALDMPASNDPNLVTLAEIPKAKYSLSSIQTFASMDGSKGGFNHAVSNLGSPENKDSVCQVFDGSVPDGEAYYLSAKLYIPLHMLSKSNDLVFHKMRYYWNQVSSKSDGWAWQLNGSTSVGGTSPLRPFTTLGTLDGKIYKSSWSATSMSAAFQLIGTDLILTYSITEGQKTLRAKLTYKKTDLSPDVVPDETGVSTTISKTGRTTASPQDSDEKINPAPSTDTPHYDGGASEPITGITYPSWGLFGAKSKALDSDKVEVWSQVTKTRLIDQTFTAIKMLELSQVVGEKLRGSLFPGTLYIGNGATAKSVVPSDFSIGKLNDLRELIPQWIKGDISPKLAYPFPPFCEITSYLSHTQASTVPARLEIARVGTSYRFGGIRGFRFEDKDTGNEVMVLEGQIYGDNTGLVACYAPSAGKISNEAALEVLRSAFRGVADLKDLK